MSRFWQTMALIQFVVLLLRTGVWWWVCLALLVFDLVQLWRACRREVAAQDAAVVVVRAVER